MIDQKIKVFSEVLARAVDRRTFLKRLGGAVVAGVSTMTLGPALANSGAKAAGKALASPTVSCSPPGPYCNLNGVNEPNGCLNSSAPNYNASCFQHRSGGTVYSCQVYYTYYTTGCWTTAQGTGYWTCCDCQCTNGSTCGCASYNPGNGLSPH